MNTDNNLLSSGITPKPCPECNGTSFLIERNSYIQHWIGGQPYKNFLGITGTMTTRINRWFDIVYCNDCGFTRHYSPLEKKDKTSFTSQPLFNSQTSESISYKTKIVIAFLMLISLYAVWKWVSLFS